MTQIELTATTETDDEGQPYDVIEASGKLGEDVHWTADAATEDHGYIEIQATVYDEASLDDLIAKLQQLRTAARQVRKVCGF